jgi:hypothetical protein
MLDELCRHFGSTAGSPKNERSRTLAYILSYNLKSFLRVFCSSLLVDLYLIGYYSQSVRLFVCYEIVVTFLLTCPDAARSAARRWGESEAAGYRPWPKLSPIDHDLQPEPPDLGCHFLSLTYVTRAPFLIPRIVFKLYFSHSYLRVLHSRYCAFHE